MVIASSHMFAFSFWWKVPKGYMALELFLFLQEQLKGIIICRACGDDILATNCNSVARSICGEYGEHGICSFSLGCIACDTGKLNAGAGSEGSFKDVDVPRTTPRVMRLYTAACLIKSSCLIRPALYLIAARKSTRRRRTCPSASRLAKKLKGR
jgi:hypothetical protein